MVRLMGFTITDRQSNNTWKKRYKEGWLVAEDPDGFYGAWNPARKIGYLAVDKDFEKWRRFWSRNNWDREWDKE